MALMLTIDAAEVNDKRAGDAQLLEQAAEQRDALLALSAAAVVGIVLGQQRLLQVGHDASMSRCFGGLSS